MRPSLPRLAALVCCCATLFRADGAEPPVFTGQLSIVRYDMPLGRSSGLAPTRQLARRDADAPEGMDWPDFTLNGQPLFRERAEEQVPLKLRQGAEGASPFQMPGDDVIQPGNHWLRAMDWRSGRRHIYTADRTARSANAGAAMSGRYELWLFPILIKGEGGPVVKNVEVKADGAVVYHKAGPWRSLTLLLPQNEPGHRYELSVDGRPPVLLDAGLQAVKLGNPREMLFAMKTTLAGDGPRITVQNLARPERFPNPKEWAADLAALAQPWPVPPVPEPLAGLARHFGKDVARSPLTLYAAALPHGRSGGFFKKGDNAADYAARVADLGYDTIFDPALGLPAPGDPESFEQRADALVRRGVRLGLQYDNRWSRPSLQHPNVAFFAHTLPDWHAPLYRSLSLAAQRFARLPGFAGFDIGSDNGGYVSHWQWAPPIPDRPWGEAMSAFLDSPQPRIPRAASLGPRELPYEEPVKTQAEFIKHVEHYDTSFRQYGYFAEAVREVDPALVFTTGAYGSSPGAGGRGGWPWASIPGRIMFEGLATQQAYDWNELRASKPMHNVALTDRIRSYAPTKRTWTILDNFQFLFGREAFQRAAALALTRGVQGIGTNFLASSAGEGARPDVAAWQQELNAWMRKYGGVYARTEPQPVIGIFFGHLQTVQRRILTGEDASPEALLKGSHEGKVTEALFLCHAAGWPARVITYQELRRGPLPPSMKAIVLTGLDQADGTWTWGPGLEKPLQEFLDRGGRILADDESVCPVPFTKTGMQVAAYIPQTNVDATPLLLARNAANIEKLRAAMSGVAAPVASSGNPLLWAIPTECADTQYVTVVNQAFADGDEAKEYVRPADPRATKPEVWKTKANASLYVKPQTGALKWNTDRPIYDVRLGRKITPEEAATVDLTADAFRWYALPSGDVRKPEVAVSKGTAGFYEATITMRGDRPMDGIPVEITVTGMNDKASVFSSTGAVTRLPLHEADAGDYLVTATELLTGLSESAHVEIRPMIRMGPPVVVGVSAPAALKKFAARKNVALTIALTPEQRQDGRLAALAKTLKTFYEQQGRIVSEGTVAPGGVVESLQPLSSPHRYPQWRTIPSDLILFGTPANNVLILDQLRAEIFPRAFSIPSAGQAAVIHTRSPFVGEYDVINIIAADAAGAASAVQTMTVPGAAR